MDKILHHLRNHDKPIVCWYLQGKNHFQVSFGGAGFRPSTVWLHASARRALGVIRHTDQFSAAAFLWAQGRGSAKAAAVGMNLVPTPQGEKGFRPSPI